MIAISSPKQPLPHYSWPALLLLCALMLALVACRGNDDELPPPEAPLPINQSAPGTQLRLECSQSCKERAQCGQREVDNSEVVLMNRGAPSVDGYDMAIPSGTTVTVQELRAENVREFNTQNVFAVTFLRVTLADQVQEGWVPDWCLAYP